MIFSPTSRTKYPVGSILSNSGGKMENLYALTAGAGRLTGSRRANASNVAILNAIRNTVS